MGECACGEGVRRGAQGSIHSPSSSPSACAAWEAEGEGYTHLRSFWTPAWWWEWLPGGGEEGGKWSERGTKSAWTSVLFYMISFFSCERDIFIFLHFFLQECNHFQELNMIKPACFFYANQLQNCLTNYVLHCIIREIHPLWLHVFTSPSPIVHSSMQINLNDVKKQNSCYLNRSLVCMYNCECKLQQLEIVVIITVSKLLPPEEEVEFLKG